MSRNILPFKLESVSSSSSVAASVAASCSASTSSSDQNQLQRSPASHTLKSDSSEREISTRRQWLLSFSTHLLLYIWWLNDPPENDCTPRFRPDAFDYLITRQEYSAHFCHSNLVATRWTLHRDRAAAAHSVRHSIQSHRTLVICTSSEKQSKARFVHCVARVLIDAKLQKLRKLEAGIFFFFFSKYFVITFFCVIRHIWRRVSFPANRLSFVSNRMLPSNAASFRTVVDFLDSCSFAVFDEAALLETTISVCHSPPILVHPS